MKKILRNTLAVSSLAIALSAFAHPTVLQAPQQPAQAVTTAKDGIVDASKLKPLSFDFHLTKNGKSINSATAHVLSGDTYKYSVTDETGYVESASEKDGVIMLTPGTVRSGFELEMSPILRTDGNITLSFDAKQTDLNSMDKALMNGLEVQEPNTSTYTTKQVVQIVKGETFQAQFTDREKAKDKYVLTIKANI